MENCKIIMKKTSPNLHPSSPKIVFIGTPEFGAIILEKLCEANFKPYSGRWPNEPFRPVLVVTAPDKPVGRKKIITPPPVKIVAQKYNIPVSQPEILVNSKSQITNSKPDLIIVAAYGQILPKEILEIPKYGCLNVHPSLLPKYRGASPIQYAILNKDKETGVTIILMDKKMDHGKIISNSKFLISNKEITYPELQKELAKIGANLLLETIPKWIKGAIKPKAQDESAASYTKILTKKDGKVDWRKSADEIEKQIRAYSPWPGSWTFWQIIRENLLRVKILKADVFKSHDEKVYPIGKVLVVPQNEPGIQCGKDFLVIKKLQLDGKKPMNSEEFLRGHPDFIGIILK